MRSCFEDYVEACDISDVVFTFLAAESIHVVKSIVLKCFCDFLDDRYVL